MKVDIIPIGNSRGVRLPKALLEQCGFSEAAEIEVKENRLVLTPFQSVREGWSEAFKTMAANGGDVLLDDTIPNDFDESEWEW